MSAPVSAPPFKSAITIALVGSLCACGGGSVSFNADSTQVKINENTEGVFWQADAQAQGDAKNLTYKITGEDAALFTINTASGELAFTGAADFEKPMDANKDNEYIVDIKASTGKSTAKQHVHILVQDVSTPVITLIKPQPNENIGKGDSLDIETLVRFFDAESNTPLKDGSVTVNTSPLIKDTTDPQLWKGKITVPEGGMDFTVTGYLSDRTPVKSATKLFNKRDAFNPSYLAANPGTYLVFFDPVRGMFGKISITDETHRWSEYIQNNGLRNLFPTYDWNSRLQTIYAFEPTSERLFAFGIGNGIPTVFYAGSIPGIVNLTYDITNRRVIVLTKNTELGTNRYRALALATDDTKGFANAQTESGSLTSAVTQLIWDLPSDIISGTFKYFNFHRASKTYIIADERSLNNIKRTVVQGFGEDGQKKFEATIGSDISNLAINDAAGQVYVAENHSAVAGRIKAIDISSGEVRDLVESYGASAVGAYTNIHIDIPNKRLYVGDDVSDSIFVVDLVTHAMSELEYGPAVVPSDGEN